MPVATISMVDNFFKLGGNSILILELKNKLSVLHELEGITIADLFKYTSIKQLVNFIYSTKTESTKPINNASDTEIAIIAMSGAFSGCGNLDEYWELIKSGQEGIKHYTLDECKALNISDKIIGNSNFIASSGHIPDIDKFDAPFWGMAPLDAKLIDPQIRKFVEHCWYVLEDAGYLNSRSELNIGVFAGCGNNKYLNDILKSGEQQLNLWAASHLNSKDALATQTSYLLGLTGLSNNINTACSTSLVTIIEACKSLTDHYCDMAIAGGVSLLMPDEVGYTYQEGMILSKDGHCRVFDAESSGTVIGSGIGVILLKRLADAKRDNDNIVAVIKGYATNNDGDRKMNYTSPSVIGQTECIINAWKMADIDKIDYIECHGTATNLGDPIEMQALSAALQNSIHHKKPHHCVLGAVKANIGHTDTASGIAGVIKVCKMLKDNIIPKQINFNVPNPEINLQNTNFTINTKTMSWTKNTHKIAGVSSFGIGGTNAHVVITNYVNQKAANVQSSIKHNSVNCILPISAKSKLSLDNYKLDLINYLADTSEHIADIAYTLQTKRQEFEYRLAMSCNSRRDAIQKLQIAENIVKVKPHACLRKQDIIFTFPGQGSQYANMSMSLYEHNEIYRNTLNFCINIVNKQLNLQFEKILLPALFNEQTLESDINQTKWAQPALFIVGYSLAKLLETLDIQASAFIGLSIGELIAATLSGVFTLEDAIKLVLMRSQLMQNMAPGSMLSIQADMLEIKEIIDNNNCEIAVISTLKNFVVAGKTNDIRMVKQKLDEMGILSTILKVSHAYHSHLMRGAASEFLNAFDNVTLNMPNKPFISNITGDFITNDDAINPHYWSKQIRQPVLLADGIKTLLNHFDNPFFIEVGVGKSLIASVQQIDESHQVSTVQLLNSYQDNQLKEDISTAELIISKLWMHGYKFNFAEYYNYTKYCNISTKLPQYHFERRSYWINPSVNIHISQIATSSEDWFYQVEWMRSGKLRIANNYVTEGLNILIIYHEDNQEPFIKIINRIKLLNAATISTISYNSVISKQPTYSTIPAPDLVFYFTSITTSKSNDAIILYSVYQNLISKNNKKCKFLSFSCNNYLVIGNEKLQPFPAVAFGYLKPLALENRLLHVTHYDILENDDCIVNYLNEFINSEYNELPSIYAIRNGYRWCPIYVQSKHVLTMQNIAHLALSNKICVITGGAGGIGTIITQYIIEHSTNTTLIVLGRQSEEAIKNTEFFDSYSQAAKCKINLIYLQCDIGSIHANDLILKKMQTLNINKIDMVLHFAGVAAKSSLQQKNIQDIMNVLNPKINGTINLINLALKIPIEMLINFSALSSIIPHIGNMEYAAANTFLNEISDRHFPNIHKIFTITLNQINDKGMAYEYFCTKNGKTSASNKLFSLNNIKSTELPEILNKAMNLHGYNIIISKQNIDTEIQNLFANNNENLFDNKFDIVIEEDCSVIEKRIAIIFSEVLGLYRISIYDQFFELGGTSLTAIKLMSKLKTIGIHMTLADIVTINTVNQIYTAYENNVLGESSDKIILPLAINHEFTDKNVFFIHPVGGTVLLYLDIVKNLTKTYNYYGIQNINILGKKIIKADTLEKLSTIYLQEILKIQSQGEYILMGSSMGGNIAYEIAKQLSDIGKKVKFVTMFDAWVIFSNHFHKKDTFVKITKGQVKYKNIFKDVDQDGDYSTFLINARWLQMKLALNYRPMKSNINIHLYKASELDKDHITNGEHYDNGWQQYTNIPITIHTISGNHVTIHANPGLSEIIKLLNQSLNCNHKSL